MPAQKKRTRAKTSAPKNISASSQKSAPIRREVFALVLFFLSVFSFLTFFGVSAWFLDLLAGLMRRMIGWGYAFMPPALLCAALELAFHKQRPVCLRVTSTLLIPLLAGTLNHLSAFPETEWGWELPGGLMRLGLESKGGGLLGGLIAASFSAVFSPVGAGVVFAAGLIVLLFTALRLSPAAIIRRIADWRQSRPAYERRRETVKPEPARAPVAETKPEEPRGEGRGRADKRPSVDIPIGGEPVKADPLALDDGTLYRPKPESLKTPAQALLEPDEPLKIPQVFTFERAPALNIVIPDPPPAVKVIEHVEPSEMSLGDKEFSAPKAGVNAPETVEAHGESVAPPVDKLAPPGRRPPPDDDWDININGTDPLPYRFPPFSLLGTGRPGAVTDSGDELKQNADRLMDTLKSFGLEASIIGITKGPAVARYDLELEKGIKLSKLVGLSEDIALSLGSSGVRIAPVPDEPSIVGIEVPNKRISAVYLRDVVDSKEFSTEGSRIAFAVGRDISGRNIIGNIAKLTHLLIAGTTGSGKSVCINSLIVSLLYKASPADVRLIMVDPKMVELDVYNGIPHLLVPVVTDPKKASSALQWAVLEMERRYKRFMERGVRDIFGFNELCRDNPELERMPQIVIVIDELADLMLVAAKEVEESIVRIAQKARAAGMHLVVATQRPSADVITGLMKANIPSRIAFAVSSAMESRIILDGPGADKLVGNGDMIYQPMGSKTPRRVQGSYITTAEVEAVVSFIKQGVAAEYSDEILTHMEHAGEEKKTSSDDQEKSANDADELLPAAVEVVLELGQASTSMLQRRLSLGYARAARIVDQMEQRGIVGPYEGSKPRAVLITRQQWQEKSAGNILN